MQTTVASVGIRFLQNRKHQVQLFDTASLMQLDYSWAYTPKNQDQIERCAEWGSLQALPTPAKLQSKSPEMDEWIKCAIYMQCGFIQP